MGWFGGQAQPLWWGVPPSRTCTAGKVECTCCGHQHPCPVAAAHAYLCKPGQLQVRRTGCCCCCWHPVLLHAVCVRRSREQKEQRAGDRVSTSVWCECE